MRNCIPEETLQAWFDGELAASEAGTVAAHLNGCLNCAEVARMVEAENLILSKGLTSEFEAAIPTDRLRERIGTAVTAFQQANMPPVSRSFSDAVREFFASFRPLAYASIGAVILIVGVIVFLSLKQESTSPARHDLARNDSDRQPAATSSPSNEQPPDRAALPAQDDRKIVRFKAKSRTRQSEPDARSLSWQQRQYDYAIARLNEAIRIQPAMRTSEQVEYAYNLAVIDNAIAAGREAARRNPTDPQAAQSMLAAYQSKVDLLNQIASAREIEK